MFTKEEINQVLVNCKKTIESNPEKLFAILDNPKEIADIVTFKNKATGLWHAVDNPFPSTIEANPEVFGVKAKSKAEPAEINGILSNCQNIIVNNPQAIYDILGNPQSLTRLSSYEDKGLGLFKMLFF